LRRAGLVAIALGLAACGDDAAERSESQTPGNPSPSPTPPVVPTPIEPPDGPLVPSERPPCPETNGTAGDDIDVQVEWSSIVRTSGCWFFSGPPGVGRDDRLGTSAHWRRNGETATLAFGDLTFSGSPMRLERVSSHDAGGAWTVQEVIEGEWRAATIARHETTPCPPSDATFVGTYVYHECEERTRPSCPGRCTITANVTLRAAR
jgi:hypothetical protein